MIAPSLHPESIRAQAVPRGRFAFGLTQRTIWLLAAGLSAGAAGLLRRAAWLRNAGVGCGCAARSIGRLVCACRRRAPSPLNARGATRLRSTARLRSSSPLNRLRPSEAERFLSAASPTICHAHWWPRQRRTSCAPTREFARLCATKSNRGNAATCKRARFSCAMRRPGTRGALGQGAARADGEGLSGAAPGRGSGDFSRARPADRSRTAPDAPARTGPRLREPARVSRGRRSARRVLDGHSAARRTDHAALPDRAQPGSVDRARRGTACSRPASWR